MTSSAHRIRELVIPTAVSRVMDQIRQAGGEVFIVGGAVRRWVWERHAGALYLDWDLTTNLSAEVLEKLAAGQKHPGERFGTFRLGENVEVTLMRREGDYQDARHPSRLVPTMRIEEDLERRDFTVNAVGFDGNRIAAVPHGLEDMDARRLRAVGQPEARFLEDPLRILRLTRMMAVEQASADPETLRAAQDLALQTQKVSRERRLAEFLRFLDSDRSAWLMWEAAGLSWAMEWPPGWHAQDDVRWLHTPRSALGRLAAYHLFGYGTLNHLHAWMSHWPVPRDWSSAVEALGRAGSGFDPGRWTQRARWDDTRSGWLFRDLAEAAGVLATALEPVHVALGGQDIMREFGLAGPQLGAVLRWLRELTAADPRLNRPDVLRAKIRDYLQQFRE